MALSASVPFRPTRPAPRKRLYKSGRESFRPVLETLEERTLLSSTSWKNAVNGDWAVADNWTNGVPTAGVDAIINFPFITVTVGDSETDAANSLTSRAAISIQGGSLSLAATSTVEEGVSLSSFGTLTGAGTVTLMGTSTWSSGTMSGTGATVIVSGGTLNVSGSISLDTRTLTNLGTINWQGSGINAINGAILDNQGTIIVGLSLNFTSSTGASFNNSGMIEQIGADTSVNLEVPFNNAGTASIQGGNFSLKDGGSSTGTFDIASGASVSFNGGTYVVNSGAVFKGVGTVDVGGGFSSSTLTLDTGVTITNFQMFLTGVVNGPGTLTVTNTFIWNGGTMSGTGSTVIAGSGTLTVTASVRLDTRTLTNLGLVVWNGAGLDAINGAVVDNQGTFTIQQNFDFTSSTGATGIFNNNGLLQQTGNASVATIEVPFNNNGGVRVQTGTLNLLAGGSGSAASSFLPAGGATLAFGGGTYVFDFGVAVGGAGTFQVGSPFSNNSTLMLGSGTMVANFGLSLGGLLDGPGMLTVTNILTWNGGTMAGTGATVIAAGATMNLGGGTLDTRTLTNLGDIVSAGGSINTINGAIVDNQGTFTIQSNLNWISSTGPTGVFNNSGLLQQTGNAGFSAIQVPFNNTGMLSIETGTLNLKGGGSSISRFDVAGGATLSFNNAKYFLNTGAAISGAGKVDIGSDSTLTLAAAITITNMDMVVTGLLDGPGTLTITNAFTWFGGVMGGTGTTVIAAGAMVTIPGDVHQDTRTFINQGTVVWTDTGGSWALENGAVLNNLGTFDVQGRLSLVNTIGTPGTFHNNGLFEEPKPDPQFVVSLGVHFDSTGTMDLLGGGVSGPDSAAVFNGSTFLASQPSTTVNLTGDLVGNTQAVDAFRPLGTTEFNGPGSSTAPQHLEVMGRDLGAVAAGFDRNFVYGKLDLESSTHLQLVDNARNSQGVGPEALYVDTLIVPTGTTLDMNQLHVYARATQITGTIVGGTVQTLPDGGPIAFDYPTPGNISPSGNVDDWTFAGRAGQAVTVALRTGFLNFPSPLSPFLNFGDVRLVDSNGTVLAQGSSINAGTILSLSSVALPASGTYHIQVRAASVQPTSTGFYLLTLSDVTPASTLLLSGFGSSASATVPGSFTVTARDSFGNVAVSYTGAVHFTSSDSQAVLPADYTFNGTDRGIHVFSATLNTLGTQSLTATDIVTASITGTESGITVKPFVANLRLTGFQSSSTAGTAGMFTVTAVDAAGHAVTAYTGTVHFSSSDPLAGLPVDYTFTAGDAGVHIFSATLKTAGNQSLTATDTLTALLGSTQSGIAVRPAAASKLIFENQPIGGPVGLPIPPVLTVAVADAFGNVVTSDSSTVHIALGNNPGGASLAGTTTAAVSDGVAVFPNLSITRVGSGYTLTASDGTLVPAVSNEFTITPGVINVSMPSTLVTNVGVNLSTLLASFTDSDASVQARDFTATINWSDGHTGPGTVTNNTTGGFNVQGSHSYASEGAFPISISIADPHGANGSTFDTVHVARTGPAPRLLTQVANDFTHSPEYFTNVVTAAYQRFLHRSPDAFGLNSWVTQFLQSGLTDEHLEAGFIGSPEYIQNHGGNNRNWIIGMYMDLLGRAPAEFEVQIWLTNLANGMTTQAVAFGFAASQEREGQRIVANYQRYLGRSPESQAVIAFWVNEFESGRLTNEGVVAGFVGSQEYFSNHFGNIRDWIFAAYQDLLDRLPDNVGLNAWTDVLLQS